MAALTPTLIQHFNVPKTLDTGATERRMVNIYLECTSTGTDNTINLATYIPGFSQVTTITEALDGAINGGTFNTWSGSTLTLAGHSGSGVWKMFIEGYY